ncbi:hypothetical protein LHGZ1_1275 [Laribacter hongkongensis]|uniref:Uncharacterized protein n=1 Tax=Laribacter hongkongensis TaxID=168471 RepID=A0A248LI97_9NEIS|nr:hypothetical protein LHGZ1_1275 [Laribacter hongkongensis]
MRIGKSNAQCFQQKVMVDYLLAWFVSREWLHACRRHPGPPDFA